MNASTCAKNMTAVWDLKLRFGHQLSGVQWGVINLITFLNWHCWVFTSVQIEIMDVPLDAIRFSVGTIYLSQIYLVFAGVFLVLVEFNYNNALLLLKQIGFNQNR